MTPFGRAVEFVLSYEGGLSDDPQDSGGLTHFGISQKTYPHLDIRNLTREGAIEIYRDDYWQKCKCDQLPAHLALIAFDSAVNQGPPTAIRLLQRSLGVRDDGIIGPQTIAAAEAVSAAVIIPEFIARRGYQYALHPQSARYGLGWFRRLAACHQLALEV